LKKAKDYAEQLKKCGNDTETIRKEINSIVLEMIQEIGELSKSRNIKTNSALKSIILEQDQKWKSLCNKVNTPDSLIELKRDGFINGLKKAVPMTAALLTR
jgi:hypothetical protein